MSNSDEKVIFKFCSKVSDKEDIRRECVVITETMLKSQPQECLKKLAKLTGKTYDELIEDMSKSCPSCPD